MSYPFRSPVSQDDNNDDKWTPPSYAQPSAAESDKWSPPDYATAVEEKKEKPKHQTLLSGLSDAAQRTKDSFRKQDNEPKQEAKKINPDITREDTNILGFDQNKWADMASKLPEKWHGLPIRYPAAFVGSLAGTLGEAFSAPEQVATDFATSGIKRAAKTAVEEELPIRQNKGALSREIPYKMDESAMKDIELPSAKKVQEDTRPLPTRSPNLANVEPEEAPIVKGESTDDRLYRLARERFNMGKELPTEEISKTAEESQKPTAKFMFNWPEAGGKQYNVIGGPYDRSTVGEARLKELGIEVPTDETPAVKPKAKQSFVNPFEKPSAESDLGTKLSPYGEGNVMPSGVRPSEMDLEEWKPPSYAEEVKKEPKKAITVENAPPGQRAKMFRGAHEPVDILFDDPVSRQIFGSGSRSGRFSGTKDSAMKAERFQQESKYVSSKFNVSEQEARKYILDYNTEVRKLGSAVDKDGGNIKAPSFSDFIQKSKAPETIEHPLMGKTPEGDIVPGTPEALHPQLTSLKNYGDGVLHLDFDKSTPMTEDSVKEMLNSKGINANVTEMTTNDKLPSRFRIDVQGDDPVHAQELGDNLEKSVGGAFDNNETVEMQGGLGGIKPSSRELEPNKGPYGAALDKLFNSMGTMSEKRVQQDIINRTERAKRFAAFSDVKDEGAIGAAKSLSTLKGEFEKVDFDKLKMTKPQVDSLFTAVKRAKITPGEKARGYTTLFKILNGSELPQRNELKILDDVFGNNFADKFTQMHGGIGAVGLKVSKLANTMKSMQNSISLAAPLRHGVGLIARKEFYPAFRDMFKFYGDKEFYNYSMRALQERPNYMLGREGGLFLSKPNSMLNSEEEFLNSYVGDIAGVRNVVGASQRAYSGFLNKLRADTFDSMVKQAKDLGVETGTQVGDQIIPSKETKAIARYINNATGRGSLGSLNKMTNELNMLLWSPRMISSRLTMLTDPTIYTSLPKGMRLDGLKSLLGIAALGTTIDTLAAYGGAKVSSNILSTDFGKSRFGTKLIDPWGGFQQYIVGAARFLAGKTDNDKAYPPTSRMDIAGQILKNKESPAASFAHDLLTARKFTGDGEYTSQYGNKTSIQSEAAKRFTPIFLQDLKELSESQPNWSDDIGLNTALGVASLAGMSQQYPERKAKGSFGFRKLH